MLKGGNATTLWGGVVRPSLCLFLALSISACYSRPFFDKPVPPGAAPEQPAPAELAAEAGPPTVETPVEKERQIGGVYRGTDTFVRRGAPPAPAVVRTPAGEVTLNFVDADLREVVKAILGDTLGANYVMDPQVQGTVTLQTSQPVPGSSLVSVLESILAVNNAVLVQSDGVYKIVPADQGIRGSGGVRTALPPATQAPGAQVMAVPLKHISAAEVEKLLTPFAPPGGILRVDPRRNLVVIGGSRSDVASMLDVIETFDVDWLSGMSFGLFPVHSTSAKTIVEELEKVFGDQTEGPLAGVVRFVPIERLNAVLAISSRSQYIDRAQTWISRLDVGEGETPRLYVYYCENSRAEDLAAVLGQVFGQQAAAGQARPVAQVAPGLEGVTLQGRQGGPVEGGGPSLGTSRGPSPNLPSAAPPMGGATQGGGPIPGGGEAVQIGAGTEAVKIIADKVKNALVIQAKPSDYRTVESAIRKLDIVPMQVLIEATIFEVTLNDALRYGVEWFFRFGGSSKVVLSDTGAVRVDPTNTSLLSGAVNTIFPGFSYVVSPTQDSVKAVINALDQVSDVNVISSPQVFVLDNQTATLIVGDQVPITTRSAVSVISADAPTVNSIEYRDTGVILEVTPRVNAGGLVTMEISQEVSNVSVATTNTQSQQDSPTINQRKVESTVSVQGGETVALGGLITDRRENASRGLPFLSRLPVIGWLFGTKSDSAARTELLVLITPRVVGSTDQARQVTQELRSRLRAIAPLEQRLR
jgi:general secretion pathway protein D